MLIYSVFDQEFRPYGHVLEGYDIHDLKEVLKDVRMPEDGVYYEPSTERLEALPVFEELVNREFGGLPTQMGICFGYNHAMNLMEYHRGPEIILCLQETILLLGKIEEIVDGVFDTDNVKAFRLPANTFVEMYQSTLHNCPIPTDSQKGFQACCLLARGTNEEAPEFEKKTLEDQWLVACNNWSIFHPDTEDAAHGAYAGIIGKNLGISDLI